MGEKIMDIRSAIFYAKERQTEILLESHANISQQKADSLNRESAFLAAAMAALEKRKPEKPTEENRYYGNGKCPCCGVVFMDKSTSYCGKCGQALDWG